MKKRSLLFKGTILLLMVFVGLSTINSQTLMHSYTFEDGTYDDTNVFDQTGTLNGVIGGDNISIADGKCTVSGATVNTDGWISFDGASLALNTYSSLTVEFMIEAGNAENVDDYTMLAYFGTSTPGNGCLWFQPTRQPNDESKFETNNTSSSIAAYSVGNELDDGKMHHVVGVLTGTRLVYYLDGALLVETATGDADYISTIGTDVANLFRGVDGWNDPNYNGSILEFNIYEGEMDEATVYSNYVNFVGEDYVNSNLADLSANPGDLAPAFSTDEIYYDLYVPFGQTETQLNIIKDTEVSSYVIYDGQGNPVGDENDIVTFGPDGIDLEIEVTALDGTTTKSYYVSIYHYDEKTSDRLSDIVVTNGSLGSEFHPDTTGYYLIADYGVTSVTIEGIAMGSNAVVTGNGEVQLTDGVGSATIHVVSEDGLNEKDYNLSISTSDIRTGQDFYIVNEESGLVLEGQPDSYINQQNATVGNTAQLFQLEDSGVDGQYYLKNGESQYLTLTPISVSEWDMVMTPTLTNDLDSCRFGIKEFEPGRFKILTVARASQDVKKYVGAWDPNPGDGIFSDLPINQGNTTWNIKLPNDVVDPYETHLSSLTCDQATLKPAFDSFLTEYYMTTPKAASTIDINAIPIDENSLISGAGNVEVTETAGDFIIKVSGADPAYFTEYVIHYVQDTELTLKHSYTFEDGSVRDMQGSADGVAMDGYVDNGMFVSDGDGGYITLPAEEIAINTYPSITMEAYVKAGANDGWSMLSYFGGLSGYKSYWVSVQNNDNVTRAVIDEWQGANSVQTVPEASDGEIYHYVTTLTNDSISLYINGQAVPKIAIHEDYYINDLSTENAWICKGGYPDPTWLGSVYEFNIYSGEMDEATILSRAQNLPEEDATTDATLSDLTINGTTIEGFNPVNISYTIAVDEGSTPVIDGTVKVAGATYVVNAPDAIPGIGTVVVTASDGSTQLTYSIEFEIATGIGNGVKESNVKVYPTISSGEFTVEVNGQSSIITVFDLSGRLVTQVETNNKREVISIENRGMYILKVDVDGETELFKVIKK
ncbi:LamG-like jellyroll fold domain-containing protein [Carboxylicivirga linearis]|uniref:Cadherin-like beta sandwich domain-containing protein n=1 Tax=Carboxylicivirga linearis TaxID=1628157 RepID=A0ABS5JY75_9BACT|nr:LamG-like jellyroll fold domain-containing protein [Carboxylicivirga linearis]MBS2099880.1 cadherin-like beta sandwich domain-containing protein [Carboxylicivirga linearis]